MTIPAIPKITVEPRLPNPRLWLLERKRAERSATSNELLELDCLCRALDSGQDMDRRNV